MISRLLPFVACLLFGCAHQPVHYSAPSPSVVHATASRLRTVIAQARDTAASAQAAVGGISAANARQAKILADDAAKLDALFKAAPPELRDAIAEVQNDVKAATLVNADILARIADAQRLQAAHAVQLNTEIPVAEQALAKAADEYVAEVNVLAKLANDAEIGWAKDSAEIVRLRTASWLHRLAAGLGLLALAGIMFLWFTGRIATATAAVASKIP